MRSGPSLGGLCTQSSLPAARMRKRTEVASSRTGDQAQWLTCHPCRSRTAEECGSLRRGDPSEQTRHLVNVQICRDPREQADASPSVSSPPSPSIGATHRPLKPSLTSRSRDHRHHEVDHQGTDAHDEADNNRVSDGLTERVRVGPTLGHRLARPNEEADDCAERTERPRGLPVPAPLAAPVVASGRLSPRPVGGPCHAVPVADGVSRCHVGVPPRRCTARRLGHPHPPAAWSRPLPQHPRPTGYPRAEVLH